MSMPSRLASTVLVLTAALVAACADDAATTTSSTSGSGGGGGGATGPGATTTGAGGATTTGATTGTTTGASTSTTTTGPTSGSTTGSGGAGQGGSGTGGAAGWPECLPENFGGVDGTIADVWAANPPVPQPFWLPGVTVTAVSLGGCVADQFCQIFVQQEDTFASFAAGAQQAIRVQVSPEAAFRFTDVAVGDHVDLGGEPYRNVADGANELLFFIRNSTPGCMAVVGGGDPQPVDVTLDDLTVEAYEDTAGPLLVRLDTVSGRPHQPGELFALWDSGGAPGGGIETVTNMSPFFLPGGVFVGFVAEQIVDFASVTGVFGQFRPNGGAKYETVYIRSMGDAPLVP